MMHIPAVGFELQAGRKMPQRIGTSGCGWTTDGR